MWPSDANEALRASTYSRCRRTRVCEMITPRKWSGRPTELWTRWNGRERGGRRREKEACTKQEKGPNRGTGCPNRSEAICAQGLCLLFTFCIQRRQGRLRGRGCRTYSDGPTPWPLYCRARAIVRRLGVGFPPNLDPPWPSIGWCRCPMPSYLAGVSLHARRRAPSCLAQSAKSTMPACYKTPRALVDATKLLPGHRARRRNPP